MVERILAQLFIKLGFSDKHMLWICLINVVQMLGVHKTVNSMHRFAKT